jgi:hypothetical protein
MRKTPELAFTIFNVFDRKITGMLEKIFHVLGPYVRTLDVKDYEKQNVPITKRTDKKCNENHGTFVI